MNALIIHPLYAQRRDELAETLAQLQKTQEAVDVVLRQLAVEPKVAELIHKIEDENRLIELLSASVHNKDDPSENVTGEKRSLRSLLDGTVSIQAVFEQARIKRLYRELARRLHPDNLTASPADVHLFTQATAAYRAGEHEVLYFIHARVFGQSAEFEDEDELLDRLNRIALRKLDHLLAGDAFAIACAWMAGGRIRAAGMLYDALSIIHRNLQRYRMVKNNEPPPPSRYPLQPSDRQPSGTHALSGDGSGS